MISGGWPPGSPPPPLGPVVRGRENGGDNDVSSGRGDDNDAMGMGDGDLRGDGGGRGVGDGGDVRTGGGGEDGGDDMCTGDGARAWGNGLVEGVAVWRRVAVI